MRPLLGPENDGRCEHLRRAAGQYRWQNHSRSWHQRGHVHLLQRVHQSGPKYTPFLALRLGMSCLLLWLWIKISQENISCFECGSHVFPVTERLMNLTYDVLDLFPRCWRRWTWSRRWAFDSCIKWQSRSLDRLASTPIEKSKTLLPSTCTLSSQPPGPPNACSTCFSECLVASSQFSISNFILLPCTAVYVWYKGNTRVPWKFISYHRHWLSLALPLTPCVNPYLL